ncbi:MAG: hypothetical protein FWF03_04985 [Defluviitaleaceae bacterium]|nr:hypothetical protein [Defluviitaleaceae bacterium]
MQCRTHPDVNGTNTCNQCGEWLCDGCVVEINGRNFCRRCLSQLAAESGAPHAVPVAPRAAHGRHISGFLLMVFSFLPPGVNYMYEGLIKRGLAALSGFFLLIYLTAQFSYWPLSLMFGLSFPVYVLACIFDAFHIRRKINAGEAVSDDIDDVLRFVKRNKNVIIGLVVLLVALSLINSAFAVLPFGVRRWLPVVVVAMGIYMLVKSPARRKKREDERSE